MQTWVSRKDQGYHFTYILDPITVLQVITKLTLNCNQTATKLPLNKWQFSGNFNQTATCKWQFGGNLVEISTKLPLIFLPNYYFFV